MKSNSNPANKGVCAWDETKSVLVHMIHQKHRGPKVPHCGNSILCMLVIMMTKWTAPKLTYMILSLYQQVYVGSPGARNVCSGSAKERVENTRRYSRVGG